MVRVLYVREKGNLNRDILTLLGLNSHQKLALVYLLMEIDCPQIYGIIVLANKRSSTRTRPRRFDPLSLCVPVATTAQATSTISLDLYLATTHAKILKRH